jgi:hypothetical protein
MAKAKKTKTQEEKKEEIVKKCLKIIATENIVFITELCAYLPIDRATFYNWGLDKLDTIKSAIEDSRVMRKAKMRNRWEDCGAPALEMGAYKLMATDEERKCLSTSYTDITTGGDKILPYEMSESERASKVAELRGELHSD